MNFNLKNQIVLADPHPFFRMGVCQYLENALPVPMEVRFQTNSGKVLLNHLHPEEDSLVVMELNLAEKDGFQVLETIQKRRLPVKCLILSSYADPKIIKRAYQAGAGGYLLKRSDPTALPEAIEVVLRGEIFMGEGVQLNQSKGSDRFEKSFEDGFAQKYLLTRREIEVLRLISDALSSKEIARKLYISDQTVGVHRKNIMRKLGVNNVAELMRTAFDHSLI
ncbi:MAG: response regulator transcription factor [Saprospiraceae bacterium]|nr:response regulator transcription factor [Saprospiraceae bacterium]